MTHPSEAMTHEGKKMTQAGEVMTRNTMAMTRGFSGRRRGFTLVEALVALAILAVLIGSWWGVLMMLRRGEAKLTDRAAAMANAELVVARLSLDVKSMFPPDPFRPERCPNVSSDGSTLSFLRCERVGGAFTARRVSYEARPRSGNTFTLLRDGHPLGGVQLAAFSARLVAGPRGDPRLRVRLTGVSGPEKHDVELDLAMPPPGPAATIGLPGGADALLERAVRIPAS